MCNGLETLAPSRWSGRTEESSAKVCRSDVLQSRDDPCATFHLAKVVLLLCLPAMNSPKSLHWAWYGRGASIWRSRVRNAARLLVLLLGFLLITPSAGLLFSSFFLHYSHSRLHPCHSFHLRSTMLALSLVTLAVAAQSVQAASSILFPLYFYPTEVSEKGCWAELRNAA